MVPHWCLVGALVVRRRKFCVLLVRHLESAPPELFENTGEHSPLCLQLIRSSMIDNRLSEILLKFINFTFVRMKTTTEQGRLHLFFDSALPTYGKLDLETP